MFLAMNTKEIEIFTNDELNKLDVPALAFINNESTKYLEAHERIAEKLTERSYAILGLTIAVYTLLLGIIAYFCDRHILPLAVLIVCFIASVYFTGRVIKPFSLAVPGMAPDHFRQYMLWGRFDAHKEALILSIYSNKRKINDNIALNKNRMKHYTVCLYILPVALVIAILSVMLA